MTGALRLLLVGDLVLDEPDTGRFFEHVRDVLQSADVTIGHVEVPHTRRGYEALSEVPAPAADPDNLRALGDVGFDLASLAGNHIYDRGPEGIEDTIATLSQQGIAACGAGASLDEARRPAVVERAGRRIALLSYNCVGPEASWADAHKAGCAYVRVLKDDGSDFNDPGGKADRPTHPDPASAAAMQEDIRRARADADVLVVALHKGVIHTPAALAEHERPLARAAIDAGADIVVGHHAHILKGVETYRGKPIFHGLGNFVTVTRALSADQDHPARRAWALKRRERFGFEPDPDYPLYPFHPEAKNAVIADCRVHADGRVSAGFRPCWIRPGGEPEPLGDDDRGRAVADYVRRISEAAGLEVGFNWDGDRVVFQ